jgi:hypothetical protein
MGICPIERNLLELVRTLMWGSQSRDLERPWRHRRSGCKTLDVCGWTTSGVAQRGPAGVRRAGAHPTRAARRAR